MNFSTVPTAVPASLVRGNLLRSASKRRQCLYSLTTHLQALALPRPVATAAHSGEVSSRIFFVPRKFCFKHVIKRITLNCVFPQNLKVWLWAWLFPLSVFVILSKSNE